VKATYLASRIKFKGQGVKAAKEFFLASPSSHPNIPPNIYINGVITATPYKGSQEYKILWDMSPIPIPLEKSDMRDKVV